MRVRPLQRWLILGATAVILAVTLFPIAGVDSESRNCLICGDRAVADVLLNLLLFLPLGAALAAGGFSPARCVLGGALLSALVEFAQVYVPGRYPSLGDVMSNTVGAGLGVALVMTASFFLQPTPAGARRLCNAAALAAAAVCFGTGWLLAPALPTSQYFALWTPDLGRLEPYRGRVLDAMIGGIRIPVGPIANSAAVREALESSEDFSLRVRAVAGPRTDALAALVAVYDQQRLEIVFLGADRDDLVFRLRTRAARWRLDQPDIRLSGGLRAIAPGDALDVTVRGRRGRYAVSVNASAGARLGFTVGSGWAILAYPEALPARIKTLLGLAWVAALFIPAGFWARTRRDRWIVGAAMAATLLGAPTVTPLCATPVLQWGAAGLGALAGALTRLAVAGRAMPAAGPPLAD
jgi:hypothetical protein